MQDKWGSLVHGRPSHVFASNWAVKPLSLNDFPDVEYDENDEVESAEYERGRLLFTQMIMLSQILAEVLDIFYTLQAMATVDSAGPQGTHLVLQLAKPVQLKLKDWFAGLPACLRMDSPSNIQNSNTNKLSSTGFLHLAYFATEITLHRRIIRSLSSPSTSLDNKPALDPYIVHICRSAAKTRLISAMDFVNRLTSSHLRSFWYFASKTNFALIGTFGSLLWATAPGREEAEWYRRRLGEYRWTLGVSCKGGSGADGGGTRLTEFAMGMLDTSTGLLKALPEKPALSRVGSESDNMSRSRNRSIVEGYSGFGSFGTGAAGGFGIGPARGDGSVGSFGDSAIGRDGENGENGIGLGIGSGLASPSTSVSSSGGSQGGFDAYLGQPTGFSVLRGEERAN